MKPLVEAFRDPVTHSVSYVVSDPATGRAALIDPVLGFDPASGQTSYRPVERAIAAVEGAGLTLTGSLRRMSMRTISARRNT